MKIFQGDSKRIALFVLNAMLLFSVVYRQVFFHQYFGGKKFTNVEIILLESIGKRSVLKISSNNRCDVTFRSVGCLMIEKNESERSFFPLQKKIQPI
jgi:hypothetical protein